MGTSIKSLTGVKTTLGLVKKNPNVFSTGIQEPHPWQFGTLNVLRPASGNGSAQLTKSNLTIPHPRFPISSIRTLHANQRGRG